jgi:putative endonuclease
MYYVYVLYSETVKKKYTGHTENLDRRLFEHNEGLLGGYTKNKGPWKIIHSEKYPTRSEAIFKERFLKTGKGRLFIKSFTGK